MLSPKIFYFLALVPAIALAATEGLVISDEMNIGIPSMLMQAGLGGVVAVVAVKMLLVLYADKEKNAINYHEKLLSVIAEQIAVSKDMIASHGKLIESMSEVKSLTKENHDIFIRHLNKGEIVK